MKRARRRLPPSAKRKGVDIMSAPKEYKYCYDMGKIIISDPDDEQLSSDLVCDGNCERC